MTGKVLSRPETGEGALVGYKPWEKPRPRLKMPTKVLVTGASGTVSATVDVRETAQLSAWDMPLTRQADS